MEEPVNNIKQNLQIQLDELESLESMFCNPGEIKVEDIGVFHDIKDFVGGRTPSVPPCLGFTVNLVLEQNKFELGVNLPQEYPFVEPGVFVRNHKLNKAQHVLLNKKIEQFLADLPRGEPCIFTAISWLQDHALDYIEQKEAVIETTDHCSEDAELVRFWIYSHHIYSKTKRKALIDLADELKLSGFVMPGKPGIICVEGTSRDVNEFWQAVKNMNWKKIFCKITESNKEDSKGGTFLRFKDFLELVFENHGPKFNHMDMGEFYRYLEAHEVANIFKEIFGVDAKSA
ncbi:RWD domain-containing protein 2A [Dendroctonus ponderosae]|uniref:RWD domain-containing protein n=1 Tax=Dendroctonus ponderosae TaxID=77166 RepID=J3JYP6_DENPD